MCPTCLRFSSLDPNDKFTNHSKSIESHLLITFLIFRLVGIGILEWCWNVYPSTIYSSATLHLVHLVLLGFIVNREAYFSRLFGSLKSRRSSIDILDLGSEPNITAPSARTPSKGRYRLRSSIKSGN